MCDFILYLFSFLFLSFFYSFVVFVFAVLLLLLLLSGAVPPFQFDVCECIDVLHVLVVSTRRTQMPAFSLSVRIVVHIFVCAVGITRKAVYWPTECARLLYTIFFLHFPSTSFILHTYSSLSLTRV